MSARRLLGGALTRGLLGGAELRRFAATSASTFAALRINLAGKANAFFCETLGKRFPHELGKGYARFRGSLLDNLNIGFQQTNREYGSFFIHENHLESTLVLDTILLYNLDCGL